MQSLLLEGGPTLATAFLAADLVDKLLLFVAPVVGGDGPRVLGELAEPIELSDLSARAVGGDVLLEAYVHDAQINGGAVWAAPPRPQGVAAAD